MVVGDFGLELRAMVVIEIGVVLKDGRTGMLAWRQDDGCEVGTGGSDSGEDGGHSK